MNGFADPALDERPAPDLLASIRRYKAMVIGLALLGALVGAAIRVASPGSPTAAVEVTLQTKASRLGDSASLTPAAQATFVANQAAFFEGAAVAARLSRDLHGLYRPRTLEQKIHAAPQPTGTSVKIEVTDPKPATAVLIANTLVKAYGAVVRGQTESEATEALAEISAAQANLTSKLQDAFRAGGSSARATAAATASALAALTVEATQVQVNRRIYDDGIASWRPATRARGGRRAPDARLTGAGLALSLLVGVVAAWIRADRNREVTTSKEASRVLGAPLLTSISASSAGLPSPFDDGPSLKGIGRRRFRRVGDEPFNAGTADPYIRLASLVATNGQARIIAVTPAAVGAGGSTIAMGLAVAGARGGEQLLLVDADPASGRVSGDVLIEPDRPGLYEVAAGEAELGATIVRRAIGQGRHVDVLPPGSNSDRYPHLLRTTGQTLLSELANRYSRIVVDTGPLLEAAPAVALVPFVDGVITVLRHGTSAEVASAVRSQLALLQVHHLGVVFTFDRTAGAVGH